MAKEAELPAQLGHVLEIHAVEPGDEAEGRKMALITVSTRMVSLVRWPWMAW